MLFLYSRQGIPRLASNVLNNENKMLLKVSKVWRAREETVDVLNCPKMRRVQQQQQVVPFFKATNTFNCVEYAKLKSVFSCQSSKTVHPSNQGKTLK